MSSSLYIIPLFNIRRNIYDFFEDGQGRSDCFLLNPQGLTMPVSNSFSSLGHHSREGGNPCSPGLSVDPCFPTRNFEDWLRGSDGFFSKKHCEIGSYEFRSTKTLIKVTPPNPLLTQEGTFVEHGTRDFPLLS